MSPRTTDRKLPDAQSAPRGRGSPSLRAARARIAKKRGYRYNGGRGKSAGSHGEQEGQRETTNAESRIEREREGESEGGRGSEEGAVRRGRSSEPVPWLQTMIREPHRTHPGQSMVSVTG